MPTWEIPCAVDGSDVTIRVSGYGQVLSVDPPSSVYARLIPFDVEGFDDVGVTLVKEPPRILVENALRDGLDVTGLAVAIRTAITIVSSAVVSGSIRLVMSPDEIFAAEAEGEEPSNDFLSQAERFQKSTDEALQGDDLPVTLTVRQVRKIAAIASAVNDGHTAYGEALSLGIVFLQRSSSSVLGVDGGDPPLSELWSKINSFPWPPPGGPKQQPE